MAIGIRRDRDGVMPGTEAYPALVATGIVKGDVCKLASGALVISAAGDVFDEAISYLAIANYVSGVTAPAATTIDQLVMPMEGELTYIGDGVSIDTGDISVLDPGDKVDLNATGDGFQHSVSVAPTDFIIIKVLEADTTADTATLEVRLA